MAKEKLKLLLTVRAQGLCTLGEERCDVGYSFCVLSPVRLVCSCHTRSTCIKGLKDALRAGVPVRKA